MLNEKPPWPIDECPRAKFAAKLLPIRKKKGQDPIFVNFLWVSDENCGDADVLILVEYLESVSRNCHINNGAHGELDDDDKFYFRWDNLSEDFHAQDVKNATPKKNNVSLHEITKDPFAGPVYHAGVDTIDGFCKSAHKPLTEAELDTAYVRFCKLHPGAAQAALEKEVK